MIRDRLTGGDVPVAKHPVVEKIQKEIENDGLLALSLDASGRGQVSDDIARARAMAYVKFSK